MKSKSKINAAWHEKNRMPKNASEDERINWNIAHAKHCGCREMPEGIKKAIRERKLDDAAADLLDSLFS